MLDRFPQARTTERGDDSRNLTFENLHWVVVLERSDGIYCINMRY
jgi:hypothetical protein